MFIDHKLTWKEYINYACLKICKCIVFLNKVKNLRNKSSLHMLYNSLFIPYLTYCSEVWGNTYKTHLKPCFLKQKKAIRIVNKAKYLEHTDALFNTLNTLPLLLLIKLRTAILMYKIHYRKMPLSILDHLVIEIIFIILDDVIKCYS